MTFSKEKTTAATVRSCPYRALRVERLQQRRHDVSRRADDRQTATAVFLLLDTDAADPIGRLLSSAAAHPATAAAAAAAVG